MNCAGLPRSASRSRSYDAGRLQPALLPRYPQTCASAEISCEACDYIAVFSRDRQQGGGEKSKRSLRVQAGGAPANGLIIFKSMRADGRVRALRVDVAASLRAAIRLNGEDHSR